MRSLAWSALLISALVCSGQTAQAQAPATRSQVVTGESLMITAEILAIDAAKRTASFKGPLGGTFDAEIAEEVKDLGKYKAGDLVALGPAEAVFSDAPVGSARFPHFVLPTERRGRPLEEA